MSPSRSWGRASVAVLAAACGSHSTYLDLGPSPAGVTVDSRVVYYDFTGATLVEMRQAMAQQGPRQDGRVWTAFTQSRYTWTYQYSSRTTGRCELQHVKVRMQSTVTFPRWTPSAEPDSATMEWWRQVNAGLAEHERGHALISLKTAGEIVRTLEGMAQGQCDALGLRANDMARRLTEQSQMHQNEYDANTRHGITQIRQAGRLREP